MLVSPNNKGPIIWTPDLPDFYHYWHSGVSQLPRRFTINGSSPEPTFWYNGADAGAATWTAEYGSDLSITGAGDAPTLNYGSPFQDSTDGVLFNQGKHYEGGTSDGVITTVDFIFEIIAQIPTATTTYLIAKYNNSDSGWGIVVVGDELRFKLDDGSIVFIVGPGLGAGNLVHCFVVADRSGNGIMYCNGQAGSAVNISGVNGSLDTNSVKLTLGTRTGVSGIDSCIIQCALWDFGVGGLDTHAQDDLVQERFEIVRGIFPQYGKGTRTTSSHSRASTATLANWNASSDAQEGWMVGDEWIRTIRIKDTNGDYLDGIQVEDQVDNLQGYSNKLDSWNLSANMSSVDANNTDHPTPIKGLYFDGLIRDNVDTAGSVYRVSTDTVSIGDKVCLSVYGKAGDVDWIRFRAQNVGGSNWDRYFNLSTGAIGRSHYADSDDWGIIDCGNGIYRCWFVITADANNSINTYIYPVINDLDYTFAGDNTTVNTWVACCMMEEGNYPTSYIDVPSTSTVTREADSLYWKADDGNVETDQGRIPLRFWHPNILPTSNTVFWELNDGGASNEIVQLYIDTTGAIGAKIQTAGKPAKYLKCLNNFCDDTIHNLNLEWKAGWFSLSVDQYRDVNTSLQSDEIPSALDRIAPKPWYGIVGRSKDV